MKKNKITSCLNVFLTALLISPILRAEPVKEKLTNLADKIQVEMDSYAGNISNLDSLAQGKLRQHLFTLETLSELYSKKYYLLSEVQVATKGLEDALGDYRQTGELLKYAQSHGASKGKIKKLIKKQASALKDLFSYIKEEGWLNKMTQIIKNNVESIKWDQSNKDQSYAYFAISSQLNTIDHTNWDMKVLEGGVGIHDLRKQVRLYQLEAKALNDIIDQTPSCNEGPKLPNSPQIGGKCSVSSCLHDKMLLVYKTFGDIKDDGEGKEGVGEEISPEDLAKAETLYREIKTNNIFSSLANEFKACGESLN